jgi:hypothetical protein
MGRTFNLEGRRGLAAAPCWAAWGGQPGLGRPQGCNGKQRALSNAVPVPMVLGGDAPARDASWKKGQPLKLGKSFISKFGMQRVTHRASLAQWYLPQICAACQGGEWSRITRVLREGPAKPQSWCPSSTRAVSSPQSSDWRTCRRSRAGPQRLHPRDPSCGRFAANAPTCDPRRNEPGLSHGRFQGSRILRILESDHGPRSALRKIIACRPPPWPREPRFRFETGLLALWKTVQLKDPKKTTPAILSREERCGFIIAPRSAAESVLTTSVHVRVS